MTRILQFLLIVFIVAALVSCDNDTQSNTFKKRTKKPVKEQNQGLSSVLASKKIRAVTNYGSLSYFIYRGEPMGYQYELLKNLCNSLNVELELIIEKDLSKCIDMLNNNEVDILAMGLTMTNKRRKQLLFTEPIIVSRQVLVQRKPDGWRKMATADEIESHMLRSTLDLSGKTIYVEEGTVFEEQLNRLADEIAGHIEVVSDHREVEQLIATVASGEIDFTIADEHVALVNTRYYPSLDVATAVSFPQKIAWAVDVNQFALADTINAWVKTFNKELISRLLFNKYFKNIRSGRISKSNYYSYTGEHLSPYDSLIRIGAQELGWDWRLLASLVYQESEFKPQVKSWVGAFGLMQLMPSVMQTYGIDSTASPEVQIMAGVKHLKSIERQLPGEITDSLQRMLFTMAAYNSGLGHILDARRLAKKHNMDQNQWIDQTDVFVLKLSDKQYYTDSVVYYGYMRGDETYSFVRDIVDRYGHYINLIGNDSNDIRQ